MTTPRDDTGSQDPGPRVNLFDPEVQRCPWEAYRTLRNEAPVHRIPGTDIFVVTRYEHVREVLTDPQRFPSSAKNKLMRASPNGFTAMVDMHFAEGKNDFTYHPHFLLRSLKQLHIIFEPRKR